MKYCTHSNTFISASLYFNKEKVGLCLSKHYTGSKVELLEKFTSDLNKNLRRLNKKHLVGNRFYYSKSYICNSFNDHLFQFPVHCICNSKYFLFDYSVSPREGEKKKSLLSLRSLDNSLMCASRHPVCLTTYVSVHLIQLGELYS